MMLNKIVDIIDNSFDRIEGGTLFCKNHQIVDPNIISFLENNNILENTIQSQNIGESINLEMTLARLISVGFYYDTKTFIKKNRYECNQTEYYIKELNCFSSQPHDFFSNYTSLNQFISSIEKIARYTHDDVEIRNSIISKENRSTYISFNYNEDTIKKIDVNKSAQLAFVHDLFQEKIDSEKKLLFVQELIDFVNGVEETKRFEHLVDNFSSFYTNCTNAYQFYLRNFSYNKLKIELDSKALEYTQKIQGVINDSQTKLIAIPSAFVLVFVAFNFDNLLVVENIATIVSLFIFAILIQLFVNNQKSILHFTEENISSYKESFKTNDIEKISSKFARVAIELKKQRQRLTIIEVILWGIPILLLLAYSSLVYLLYPTLKHF